MTTTLFCLVDGDPTSKAFSVQIDPTETVYSLKESIKSKDERFEKIYAKNLNLWRVSVDDDGRRAIWVNDIEGTKEELIYPTVKVSKAFPPESLAENTINVIVQAPTHAAEFTASTVKRLRTKWKESVAPPVLDYKRENPTFLITSKYSLDSGLIQRDLLLRNLSRFQKQFNFLLGVINDRREEELGNPYPLGWIVGPPGIGKSTTAFAFALTVSRPEWVVTWISLGRNAPPTCVQLIDGKRRTCQLECPDSDLESELGNVCKKHILFLDGFAATGDNHKTISRYCHSWLSKNFNDRRLVILTSMSGRGKTSYCEDLQYNVKVYRAQSWTLEEYIDAANEDEFFQLVKPKLDSTAILDSTAGETNLRDLLESKYHFAGGSSRFMFDHKTDDVIDEIRNAIVAVNDVMPYIQGTVGDTSESVVNRLFSYYENTAGERFTRIISCHAATSLAAKVGPRLINQLAEVLQQDMNPAMDGWLLEMWFFACLRHSGVTLTDVETKDDMLWEMSKIYDFDPNNIKEIPVEAVWWKPIKWNQGGYDAVFVEFKKGLVQFVQVTRAKKHDFKIRYFRQVLDGLVKLNMEIKSLEIFFVYKEGDELQIGTVTGDGLLHGFGREWEKGKEKEGVRKCTVNWNV